MRGLLTSALALLVGCHDAAHTPGVDPDAGAPVSDGGVSAPPYVGLEQLYEKGISRTCSLNNGVCHNSKEYPNLQSIPAILDALNAPCAVAALKAELVPNECEPEGDHLVSAALGIDVVIARVAVSPADTTTDMLTQATLYLATPPAAGAGTDFVIRRGQIAFTVGSASIAADGTATVNLSAAPLTLKSFFDTGVFPLQPSMIHVADINGDGVLGHSLGWSLAKPGHPDRSYLVGRLTQTRLGELMPRQCRTWDRAATRALYCWLRGLQMGADGKPMNAMAPIDYSACDLPADSADKCEAVIPDGGAGSFAAVAALFARSCVASGCHAGAQPAGGLSLEAGQAYASLVGVDSSEATGRKRVVAGDPAASWLECKVDPACVDRQGGQMPLGGGPLASEDLDAIKSWIQSGANP